MTGQEIAKAVNEIIQSLNPRDFDEPINWKEIAVLCIEKSILLYPEDEEDNEDLIIVSLCEIEPYPKQLVQEIKKRFEEKYGFDIVILNSELCTSYY